MSADRMADCTQKLQVTISAAVESWQTGFNSLIVQHVQFFLVPTDVQPVAICLIWCRVVQSRDVHPCAELSGLAMSTLAIWCRVVQSRDVSPHNFDIIAMSNLAFSVAPVIHAITFSITRTTCKLLSRSEISEARLDVRIFNTLWKTLELWLFWTRNRSSQTVSTSTLTVVGWQLQSNTEGRQLHRRRQWRRLNTARALHPLLQMAGHGGSTMSRRTANKKLTKSYWPTLKRSPKPLNVLV